MIATQAVILRISSFCCTEVDASFSAAMVCASVRVEFDVVHMTPLLAPGREDVNTWLS